MGVHKEMWLKEGLIYDINEVVGVGAEECFWENKWLFRKINEPLGEQMAYMIVLW